MAGLGLSPNDVVINGSIDVRNRCVGAGNCIALVNFWRSLSNLTINVIKPPGCNQRDFWAVTRNSKVDLWTNAVWNQVFSGVTGAPAEGFPKPTYTTLATSPVTREAPFLYKDAAGEYRVFVPAVQHNSAGTSWGAGSTPGSSIPLPSETESIAMSRPSRTA